MGKYQRIDLPSSDIGLRQCPVCGKLFSSKSESCPYCAADAVRRQREKREIGQIILRIVGVVLVVVFIGFFVFSLAGCESEEARHDREYEQQLREEELKEEFYDLGHSEGRAEGYRDASNIAQSYASDIQIIIDVRDEYSKEDLAQAVLDVVEKMRRDLETWS